jgi:peptide/bleomycin uptake transporter
MFKSFFPNPRVFFWSAVIWSLAAVLLWFFFFKDFGAKVGFPLAASDAVPTIGLGKFVTPPFIWFFIYFFACCAIFAAYWVPKAPNGWGIWSVIGALTIIFATYFQVEISVAINEWYGPFYDLIQAALGKTRPVSLEEFFGHMLSVSGLLFVAVFVGVITRFLVVHFIFRWRAAMNNYYSANWSKLRTIEGASQRVQDDTMRFARSSEDIGVDLIDSFMTLIAFLPVLHSLEEPVKQIPLIGAIPYPLVTIAIFWSVFGTGLVALCAAKLPGLNFKNQRVEAAYRKELVYGEDDEQRAKPETLVDLFKAVRKNYFTLYLHQIYFNFGRSSFLQANSIMPYVVMGPTIIGGVISLGALNRILTAFGKVRESFNFLINSWYPIVELISIYKRLKAFESKIDDQEDAVKRDIAYEQKVSSAG